MGQWVLSGDLMHFLLEVLTFFLFPDSFMAAQDFIAAALHMGSLFPLTLLLGFPVVVLIVFAFWNDTEILLSFYLWY